MKEMQEEREVQGSTAAIKYLLTRKKVKNINMRIKPEAVILVSAPYRISAKYIDDFVLSKESFILQAQSRLQKQKKERETVSSFVTGERLLFMGEKITLVVQEGAAQEVKLQKGQLLLTIKNTEDTAGKEKLLKKWFRRQEREILPRICQEIYSLMRDYAIPYPQIRLRAMKSRWGSCYNTKGLIVLNTHLVKAPREAIEYVVLHELTHFVHPNHSKDFYGLLQKLMPDWRRRKEMLRNIHC